ncbi:uncharacterized protein LOC124117469 [Haliotis rufescens]|uniref:uncharacterized protein LOC124117469 n=1 Tax=Haliotis rufescens TaxID=6454 RepID=UPI001EAFB0EE|nr:uncharacterized protein LOC124117469 [Haliotis rufescens]
MATCFVSVMGNEFLALVSVLTAVLHAMGLYSRHWSVLIQDHRRLDGGMTGAWHDHRHFGGEQRFEGLWRTCVKNTTGIVDCLTIRHVPGWLLCVQILVCLSFGGALLSALMKLLYHFNPFCNSRRIVAGFVMMSFLDAFMLLSAVSIYATNYGERYMLSLSSLHHLVCRLSWSFVIETIAMVFSVASGSLALCTIRREYTEI